MDRMKTTILTSVALATCVGTQLFAQNTKQDTITFGLNVQKQVSVSTSATKANVGNWTDGPMYYKIGSAKLTQVDLLRAIGQVKYTNANFYTSKAKLVLVQGELSGFFKISPDLAASTVRDALTGTFDSTADTDLTTDIPNSTDSLFVGLPNGRHFAVNPTDEVSFPIGHMQPWGQIYVQDAGKKDLITGVAPLCENVTYFFALTVEECYDCFYLNSFISDATFKLSTTTPGQSGPPCCGTPSHTTMLGHGTDRYYLTLSFDNTQDNPYLHEGSPLFAGYEGLGKPNSDQTILGDGVAPDQIPYSNPILSHIGKPSPYQIRFTLNGIMTYGWNLKFINGSDLYPDFVGKGSYAANGYGFIQLYCSLLTGSATFTETVVKQVACCTGVGETGSWTDSWYGVGIGGDEQPTPVNVASSLSFHGTADFVSTHHVETMPAKGIIYQTWEIQ
jgi:hypothetical protein